MNEIFHSGEITIQQELGEDQIANSGARLVTASIVGVAISFIEKQPLVIASSTNEHGQIWVSLLIGDPGFVRVAEPNILLVDLDKLHSTPEDVLYRNICENPEVGLLFIDFVSRRRFRINGRGTMNDSIIQVEIREAYPNCPKYIQRRLITLSNASEKIVPRISSGNELTPEGKTWIGTADIFFVGSSSNNGKSDASHRGGNKGFVQVLADGTLKIPDYRGNSFYNTLGNILHDPHVGLLFIDFERGKTLQLTGKARLLFDQTSDTDLQCTTGTGRYWLFKTECWVCIANHHQATWEFVDNSPFNPELHSNNSAPCL